MVRHRVVLFHPRGVETELFGARHLLQRLRIVMTALDGDESDLQSRHGAACYPIRRLRETPGRACDRRARLTGAPTADYGDALPPEEAQPCRRCPASTPSSTCPRKR